MMAILIVICLTAVIQSFGYLVFYSRVLLFNLFVNTTKTSTLDYILKLLSISYISGLYIRLVVIL